MKGAPIFSGMSRSYPWGPLPIPIHLANKLANAKPFRSSILDMTVDEARQTLLSFEHAYDSSHHGHPDFRVKKGIFATLWPEKGTSVLRLPLELAESEAERVPASYRVVSRSGGMGWLSVA